MTYEDKATYDSTPPCTKFRRNSKSCHTHMIGSCHSFWARQHTQWATWGINQPRHVPKSSMTQSLVTYTWTMSHTKLWHGSKSCHTLMLHDSTRSIGIRWVIRTYDSYICDMTHTYMWHDSCTYVTWLLRICAMTHTHMWHATYVYTYVRMWHVIPYTFVTWLIHICDMTHARMRHDSYAYVTWRIHICDMSHMCTHTHVCEMTHPMHICDITHTHMWHDSHIYMMWRTNSPHMYSPPKILQQPTHSHHSSNSPHIHPTHPIAHTSIHPKFPIDHIHSPHS